MILPIVIDTSSLTEQYESITPEQINTMLDNIAKSLAMRFIGSLEEAAQLELNQTRRRYINNIQFIDSGRLEGTVLLDYSKDKLVQMIEEGASAFDMKQGFLSSPKVKVGKKGGRYLTIPYRWANPNAIADADVFSNILPKPVYNVLKKKDLTIPISGGGSRSAGLSLKEIPEQFRVVKKRVQIEDNRGNLLFKEYQHKSPLSQGLIKSNDPTTGQNRYFSFRRVSDNSEEEAWIHPGIQKYNLMQKTLNAFNTASELGSLLDSELSKIGLL